MVRRRWAQALAVVALVATGAQAWSQAGFDVNQLRPDPSQSTAYFNLGTARVLEHGVWELGVVTQYADDVLLLLDETNRRLVRVVDHQVTLDMLGSVGLFDVVELGLAVPLVLSQRGESAVAFADIDGSEAGFGLGDLRLMARAALFSTEKAPSIVGVTLGLSTELTLPTGDDARFQGEGTRFEPRLIVDLGIRGGHRLSAHVGYRVRPRVEVVSLELDDTVTFGLASTVTLVPGWRLVAEVLGEVSVLADAIDGEEVPLEVLGGVKGELFEGTWLTFGLGTGLSEGFGMPDLRFFAGFTRRTEPNRDLDDDGVVGELDACPHVGEDADGFDDDDGCPDPDNDGDVLADAADDCPDEPEDPDGWLDSDGCPDPDNDGDGVADLADRCPFAAEDPDGFDDDDGCPDPDNDGDGLPDDRDACPSEAEVYNSMDDGDGCPDALELVETDCDRISLRDSVYFVRGSDRIQPRSFELLDQVAMVLAARPDISAVRVEGHTDSRGRDDDNLELSQRRADAVRAYLIERGIDGRRLSALGLGEAMPITDDETAEGRAVNRRVEFLIEAQAGCGD